MMHKHKRRDYWQSKLFEEIYVSATNTEMKRSGMGVTFMRLVCVIFSNGEEVKAYEDFNKRAICINAYAGFGNL